MVEYIEREAAIEAVKKERDYTGKFTFEEEHAWAVGFQQGITFALSDVAAIPAADVLPRDEAIKMGAELAAMHGSDATSQQLEEAYLKGVEYGMTRRDVRPVVKAKWVYTDMSRLVCSNCGNPVAFALKDDGWHHGDYCPNCGAMMEES